MKSWNRNIAPVALVIALVCQPAIAQVAPESSASLDQMMPATLDAQGQEAVAGINSFSLDLFHRTVKADENHFVSPASVSVAVGLAYRGAKGLTATELEQVLHFGLPPADYLRVNEQIFASMNFAGTGRELRTGNAIWLQNGVPLIPDYEQDVARYAGAGLQRTHFKGDPDAAREQINDWVEERTRDRIKDLLHPGDVKSGTRSVLVNTVYWKGAWANPFSEKSTRPEPFTSLIGEKVVASLMNQRAHFRVLERDGAKAILLPYKGGEVEMVVFLPNSATGLPRFEEKLTPKSLARWLSELEASPGRETILTLPKMHLAWREDLAETLKNMGAPTAFSDAADFSGMVPFPYPEDPKALGFRIGKVIHQTFLDVDEEGSEAAAATAVTEIMVTSRRPPPPPPVIFRADKPFLFMLRDRRTGLILFMGRYVTPPAS
jgi:serpin B